MIKYKLMSEILTGVLEQETKQLDNLAQPPQFIEKNGIVVSSHDPKRELATVSLLSLERSVLIVV